MQKPPIGLLFTSKPRLPMPYYILIHSNTFFTPRIIELPYTSELHLASDSSPLIPKISFSSQDPQNLLSISRPLFSTQNCNPPRQLTASTIPVNNIKRPYLLEPYSPSTPYPPPRFTIRLALTGPAPMLPNPRWNSNTQSHNPVLASLVNAVTNRQYKTE